MTFKLWNNTPRRTLVGVDQTYVELDALLRQAQPDETNRTYVSPIGYFCTLLGECTTYLGEDKETGITSWDYGHLTPVASQAFAKDALVPAILRIRKKSPS